MMELRREYGTTIIIVTHNMGVASYMSDRIGVMKNGHLMEMGPAENYSYYIYTLRLKNNGLVPAEMVEMQVSPIDADVLFYGDTQETVIPPGGEKDVWVVLLTEGTPHSVRDLYITYYLWGHPQEVKYTYDNAR